MKLSVIFGANNKDLKRKAKESQLTLGNLKKTAIGVAASIGAAYAGAVSLGQLIEVTKKYERLQAQVRTSTGSLQAQAAAFEALKLFASETGQDLEGVTTAFTRLVNLGLDPSKEALLSYANIAAATGKTTIDFVEAVADAATGEFERLKEFGIKSRNEGDTIKFTFQGVTTAVKNNAEEIENYLKSIGQNQFGDAIKNQTESLEFALNRAGNAWDSLVFAISEEGGKGAIVGAVNEITEALEELSAMIGSGQLQNDTAAWLGQFADMTNTAKQGVNALSIEIGGVKYALGETGKFLASAAKELPANIAAMVKIMGVELAALTDLASIYGEEFKNAIVNKLKQLSAKVAAYGKDLIDKLNPFDGDTFKLDEALAQIDTDYKTIVEKDKAAADKRREISRNTRLSVISDILAERDATLKAFDQQIIEGEKKRQAYDKKKKDLQKTDLGDFKLKKDPASQFDETGTATNKTNAFDKLVQELRSEEEAINQSYIRRRQIILENTEENSQARRELLAQLDQNYAEQMMGEQPALTIEDEIARINQEFELKRQAVLANTELTEQQQTELVMRLTKQRNKQLNHLTTAQTRAQLQSAQQLFGGMADLAKTFGGEQSKTYKALFAVTKAFSIAESIIAIQAGISKAIALGFPQNIPVIASTVAQGASVISTIKGTNFQGQAHDGISKVPAANEGTWLLKRGEMVLNNKQRDNFEYLVDFAKGGKNAGGTVVKIENNIQIDARGAAEGSEQQINEALEAATERMKQELAEDFSNGGVLSQRLRGRGMAA